MGANGSGVRESRGHATPHFCRGQGTPGWSHRDEKACQDSLGTRSERTIAGSPDESWRRDWPQGQAAAGVGGDVETSEPAHAAGGGGMADAVSSLEPRNSYHATPQFHS